jgi:hypothetical protein
MLDDLDRTQAYIKKESVQNQRSKIDSAPESKFEQAQSSNAQSNATSRSRQPSTSAQESHFGMKTPYRRDPLICGPLICGFWPNPKKNFKNFKNLQGQW